RRTAVVLTGWVLAACAVPPPPPTVAEAPSLEPPTAEPTAQPAAVDPTTPPLLPTPTPFAPVLSQLTESGCCTEPIWSPDGQQVRFIDQPADEPVGIYGIDIDTRNLELVSQQVGVLSPDGRILAYLNEDDETTLRDLETDEEWLVPSDGRGVLFSPDMQRIAWSISTISGGFDERQTIVLASDLRGEAAQEIIRVTGGGLLGWLDGSRMLIYGQEPGEAERSLFVYHIEGDERTNLVTGQRIRAVSIAPGGEWVFYAIALNPDGDTSQEGFWVSSTTGGPQYRLDIVGSAQWRAEHRLLVIPLELDAPSHRLWQFNAATGQSSILTDGIDTPFRVMANNWRVAPTGDRIVFLNAADEALWLLELGPIGLEEDAQ
ncbi:MAG: TolB family protein, partial [Anaerolineae bacterium]